MDTYELKLCGVKRELPFIDLEDNLAFASFVIMGDTELITACAPELAEKIGVAAACTSGTSLGEILASEAVAVSTCSKVFPSGRLPG